MATSYASLTQNINNLLRKLVLIRPFIHSRTLEQNLLAKYKKERVHFERALNKQKELESESHGILELIELSKLAPRSLSLTELQVEIDALSSSFHEHLTTLLSTLDNASSPCLITLNAGAGGIDSDNWVTMLKNMYTRHALRHQRKVHCIEETQRSAVLEIHGHLAYAWYQHEFGVHRLIRLNPSNIRHTAFASVSVTPTSPDIPLEIHPNDIVVQTCKSGGKGGQHVNKTESAVRVIHLPSGIAIKSQQERSQHSNKATAMKLLHHRLVRKRMEEEHTSNVARRQNFSPNTFGSQIRSYVLHPHVFVKDHITGQTIHSVEGVLMGGRELDFFLEESLLHRLKDGPDSSI